MRRYIVVTPPNLSMSITTDEVLGGEPRIEGTRVGVRHVVTMVLDGGRTAAYVADQLDISLAQVHAALAYYYANPEEVRAAERANRAAFDALREESLKPKEPVQ